MKNDNEAGFTMVMGSNGEFRAAAEVAMRQASAHGDIPGSEGHLKALARESLSLAGFQDLPEEYPVRDKVIAETIKDSQGLILFEIELIWAICGAMAQSSTAWRAALVPPFHTLESSYQYLDLDAVHPLAPGARVFDDQGQPIPYPQLEKKVVRINGRGWEEVDIETWGEHVAAGERFARIFATALSGISDRFAGMVQTEDELASLAENGPVGQIRIVTRPASDHYFDPVGELQTFDKLWKAAGDLGRRAIDIIVWHSDEVNGRGYDLGHLRWDYEHLSGLETCNLREVVQLPECEREQLFIWDTAYDGPVEMTDMRDEANGYVAVFIPELRFRLDFTPSHYSYGDSGDIKMEALGTLTRKIQRGTKVSGNALNVIGTPRAFERIGGSPSLFDSLSKDGREAVYYVDNASISDNSVRPSFIAEKPKGQENYTLLPEDGTVVLVARNGKGIACYTPKRPTLVSNNLFIVWPNPDKAAPEYLACSMRSIVARSQMRSMSMPMGRGELARILIPVGPKELMDRVVKREQEIRLEIEELSYELDLLRAEDPLNQIWAEGDDTEDKGQDDIATGGR